MVSPEHFERLVVSLRLPPSDVILVSDGSGSICTKPCGWYCACYYRPTKKVTEHWGGATGGTNNYAELMPFLHTLWVIDTAWKKHGGSAKASPPTQVCCVSDSELTVNIGNGLYSPTANLVLWAGIEQFKKQGFELSWHHVPRNSNPINAKADKMANKTRLAVGVLSC